MVCVDARAPSVLRFVGDISYSLYLLHGPVGFAVIFLFKDRGFGPALPLAAAAVSMVASYGMLRLVERPSIRLGRWLSGVLAASRPTP